MNTRSGASRGVRLALAAIAAGAMLASPAVAPPAAAVTGSWRANLGRAGANGMATFRANVDGSGSLALGLLRLRPSTSLAVAFNRGSCTSQGVLVLRLNAIRTSSTGGGIRTTRLTTTQAAALKRAIAVGKVSLRAGSGTAAVCGTFRALVTQVGILGHVGSELILAGRPFHEISFDKYDLAQQFLVSPAGAWGDSGPDAVARGEAALRTLRAKGFRIVRTSVSPYYPAWFETAFFDADPVHQAQKRRELFAGFDAFLDACDRNGIRIVASLNWNVLNLGDLGHHSLHEGIVVRASLGRRRIEEYVRAVVTRYRNSPTIAMWEIGNEYNLVADLQQPGGVWGGDPRGDDLHPGPVVRDARNNFTSDELAVFYRDVATLIRSIDAGHLVTTGSSAPRPAAMHLLAAARAGAPVDWTFDSPAELTAYLALTHPDPVDVLSIHYNEDGMQTFGGAMGSPENLGFFVAAASELAKPLFVGEIGYSPDVRSYATAGGLAMLRATLPVLVELRVPLTLYWQFSDDRSVEDSLSLRYGKTDEALALIEAAADAIRR